MTFYKLDEIQGKGRHVVDVVTDSLVEARLFGGNSLGGNTNKRGFGAFYNLDTRKPGQYRLKTAKELPFKEALGNYSDLLTPSYESFEYLLASGILTDDDKKIFEAADNNSKVWRLLIEYVVTGDNGILSEVQSREMRSTDYENLLEAVYIALHNITDENPIYEVTSGSRTISLTYQVNGDSLSIKRHDNINMTGLGKDEKEAVRLFRANNGDTISGVDILDYITGGELAPLDEIFDLSAEKNEINKMLELVGRTYDYQLIRMNLSKETMFMLSLFPMNKSAQKLYRQYNDGEITAYQVIRALNIEAQTVQAMIKKLRIVDVNELAQRFIENTFGVPFVRVKKGMDEITKVAQKIIDEYADKINEDNVYEIQETMEYPNVLINELINMMKPFVDLQKIEFEKIDEQSYKLEEAVRSFDGAEFKIWYEGEQIPTKIHILEYSENNSANFEYDLNEITIKVRGEIQKNTLQLENKFEEYIELGVEGPQDARVQLSEYIPDWFADLLAEASRTNNLKNPDMKQELLDWAGSFIREIYSGTLEIDVRQTVEAISLQNSQQFEDVENNDLSKKSFHEAFKEKIEHVIYDQLKSQLDDLNAINYIDMNGENAQDYLLNEFKANRRSGRLDKDGFNEWMSSIGFHINKVMVSGPRMVVHTFSFPLVEYKRTFITSTQNNINDYKYKVEFSTTELSFQIRQLLHTYGSNLIKEEDVSLEGIQADVTEEELLQNLDNVHVIERNNVKMRDLKREIDRIKGQMVSWDLISDSIKNLLNNNGSLINNLEKDSIKEKIVTLLNKQIEKEVADDNIEDFLNAYKKIEQGILIQENEQSILEIISDSDDINAEIPEVSLGNVQGDNHVIVIARGKDGQSYSYDFIRTLDRDFDLQGGMDYLDGLNIFTEKTLNKIEEIASEEINIRKNE